MQFETAEIVAGTNFACVLCQTGEERANIAASVLAWKNVGLPGTGAQWLHRPSRHLWGKCCVEVNLTRQDRQRSNEFRNQIWIMNMDEYRNRTGVRHATLPPLRSWTKWGIGLMERQRKSPVPRRLQLARLFQALGVCSVAMGNGPTAWNRCHTLAEVTSDSHALRAPAKPTSPG